MLALVLLAGAVAAGMIVYAIRRYEFFWVDEEMQFLVLLTSSLLPAAGTLVFYHEYLVGREYLHDLRAAELIGDPQPMLRLLRSFAVHDRAASTANRAGRFVRYFFQFHPTPTQRLRSLVSLDPFRSYAVVYPVLAGAYLALVPIQLDLLFSDLQRGNPRGAVSTYSINITYTASVLSIFLLLRTEVSRFTVDLIRRSRRVWQYPLFCVLLSIGSLAAVFPLLLQAHVVRERPLFPLVTYAAIGGLCSSIGYLGIGACLAPLWGVQLLQCQNAWVKKVMGLPITLVSLWFVLCFHLLALARGTPSDRVTQLLGYGIAVAVVLAVVTVFVGGCASCGHRDWGTVLLRNRCPYCGEDRIPRSSRFRR